MQHVAIATDDIVSTVTQMVARGVEFLSIPSSYYESILERVGPIEEDLEPLHKLGILIDRDDEGYLLQIFTKPVEDRPTLFLKLYNAKVHNLSAKEISKHCLKHLNANKITEVICKNCHYQFIEERQILQIISAQ